ncbi:transferase family-domain-containing protein [Aspergillus oleicola]
MTVRSLACPSRDVSPAWVGSGSRQCCACAAYIVHLMRLKPAQQVDVIPLPAKMLRTSPLMMSVPLQEVRAEEVIPLSALDQQAHRSYAMVVLCFRMDRASSIDDVLEPLLRGLRLALNQIPDFASTVGPVPRSTRKELELRLDPWSGVPTRLRDYVQRDRKAWPYGGYEELEARHFPVANIPQELLFIAPPAAEQAPVTGVPALTVQLNFTVGGLLMGLCWHHTVGDAYSLSLLLQAWALHTRLMLNDGVLAIPATPMETNRERWRLDLGSHDATVDGLADYVADPTARSPKHPDHVHLLDRHDVPRVECVMATWYFSAAGLQSLRQMLAAAVPDQDTDFTQSEALAALVWKHLSIARRLHLDRPGSTTSLFTTRLNYRRRMNPSLPDSFVGNANTPNARWRLALGEVCQPSTPQSLATLARGIRSAINDLGEPDVRTVIGLANSLPAATDLTCNYNLFPGPDFDITDVSGLEILRQDWGRLLRPSVFRAYSRERGLVYVLPQDQDGGCAVQIQCEPDAVQRLQADEIFARYARFLG